MIQDIDIKKLHPAEYNPRIDLVPGMPEYDKLKEMIAHHGNVEPIVWNKRTGNVVDGHQRLKVLRDLGKKKVPCSIVDLSPEDEKVLNLALNKIKGEWDYSKLEDILSGMEMQDAMLTGFSANELALILAKDEGRIEDPDAPAWEDDDEGEIYESYVITLQFDTAEDAESWAEDEGYGGQIRKNTASTVIRLGDAI